MPGTPASVLVSDRLRECSDSLGQFGAVALGSGELDVLVAALELHGGDDGTTRSGWRSTVPVPSATDVTNL